MRIDEVCPVPVIEGPIGNYWQRRRDMVMRNLPMAGVGGRAEGRFKIRIIADQMYRDFSEFLGTYGKQATNHALAEFIATKFGAAGPARVAELSKTFKFLA